MLMHLAGAENWHDHLLEHQCPYQLYSFFYMRSAALKHTPKMTRMFNDLRQARKLGYRFILDSGAFTFQQAAMKVKEGGEKLPGPEEYFEQYVQFLNDTWDIWHIIIEFDVDGFQEPGGRLWTKDDVDERTDSLLDDPRFGTKIMPVYHTSRGEQWLTDWLSDLRSPYVAYASGNQGSAEKVIGLSHTYGKWIHGLAQASVNTDLRYQTWDSVDSSTWITAEKYGRTMLFHNGKLIILDKDHKAERANYREWYKARGLDLKKILADDLHENRLAATYSWREISAHLAAAAKARTKGKAPYLAQYLFDSGKMPSYHPYLRHLEKQESGQ